MWKSPAFGITGTGRAVLIAFVLGALFAMGGCFAIFTTNYVDLGLYFMLHSFFHLWEYTYVALFQPRELSANSFLLNQSTEFYIAGIMSWMEYFIESWFFPGFKGSYILTRLAFIAAVISQGIRTLAMWTAGSNFHHLIREEKGKDQVLVTFGIYNYLRHPAYFGWFWWAISTQVLLTNPICICAWSYAAWRFFAGRIPQEEATLVEFFGNDYVQYRARTPVGIPLIN